MIPLETVPTPQGDLEMMQAETEDLGTILGIFDEAIAGMVAQGNVKQWGTTPFSEVPRAVERFREWLATSTFYVAVKEEKAVGAICVNCSYPAYCWQDAPENCAYVHPFATSPSVRGQGVGRVLLRFAEEYARQQGKPYLRLDCFAEMPKLLAYYESEGFVRCGEFFVGDWRGMMYEKSLETEQSAG
jgi:GNAT superfamily N-acetyltransferase